MKRMAMLVVVGAIGVAGTTAEAGPKGKAGKGKHKDHHGWNMQFGMSEGRLGAQVSDMSEPLRGYFGAPATAGVLVNDVVADSAAAKAGIRAGDVIVEVGGEAIDKPWDVITAIGDKKAGDKVSVVIIRDRKRTTLSATLDKDSAAMAMSKAWAFGGGDDDDFDVHVLGPHSGVWAFGDGNDEQLEAAQKRIEALEKRIEALEKRVK